MCLCVRACVEQSKCCIFSVYICCGMLVFYFSVYIQYICISLAERRSSLGKDWHPTCLRCDSCDRLLSPGGHSEVTS